MLRLPERSKPHSIWKVRPLELNVVLLLPGQDTVDEEVPLAEVAAGARWKTALATAAGSAGLATGAARAAPKRRESVVVVKNCMVKVIV